MHWAFSLLAPGDPGASTPDYVTVTVKYSTKLGRRTSEFEKTRNAYGRQSVWEAEEP
jgi:hypothetical protein